MKKLSIAILTIVLLESCGKKKGRDSECSLDGCNHGNTCNG
ncbi:hypothetical protein OMO38_13380 [Chryseobacterium sp. 09-1422]|uniref:Lipoprotein n=1 Tax=Chryseobacterium kimseyorum TaxID=2984028 RepID=A0ABT3I0B4_9FLAO|nr:hypothetical protein [Chryseobacterium kimseyorum]